MINWILGNNIDINNYQESLKGIPDLERSLSGKVQLVLKKL